MNKMQKQPLIITIMGPDRPGIVVEVSRWVAECGGNWLESRLLNLGGQFAGALKVEVSPAEKEKLTEKLEKLRSSGLRIDWVAEETADTGAVRRSTHLTLSGIDQQGIVHRVFAVLGKHDINVEELKTEVRGAPWSGHLLFYAQARLSVPEAVDLIEVRGALEALGADLMVEIEIGG